MTNTSMGRSQMKECPHKTVSRFYDSPAVLPQWKCDWCGQEFAVATEPASKMVEISEVAAKRLGEVFNTGQFCDLPYGHQGSHEYIAAPKPAKKKEKSA